MAGSKNTKSVLLSGDAPTDIILHQTRGFSALCPIGRIASRTSTNTDLFQLTILSTRSLHSPQSQSPNILCIISHDPAQHFSPGSNAKRKLLGNCVRGISQFDWIRNLVLGLTRRWIAQFRMPLNVPPAIAVYSLSVERRAKTQEPSCLLGCHLSVPP
jgi:hypothetical protein